MYCLVRSYKAENWSFICIFIMTSAYLWISFTFTLRKKKEELFLEPPFFF